MASAIFIRKSGSPAAADLVQNHFKIRNIAITQMCRRPIDISRAQAIKPDCCPLAISNAFVNRGTRQGGVKNSASEPGRFRSLKQSLANGLFPIAFPLRLG